MDSPLVYRYAASVDDILEEEEHYADQLKEYLFYTEALRYSITVHLLNTRTAAVGHVNITLYTLMSTKIQKAHYVLGCACYGGSFTSSRQLAKDLCGPLLTFANGILNSNSLSPLIESIEQPS